MTCTHPCIITYHDADTGQPVQLWACAECGHRFEPMQLDDTALLRQALDALETDDWQKKLQAAINLRTRLSNGDKLSPTANLTKTS